MWVVMNKAKVSQRAKCPRGAHDLEVANESTPVFQLLPISDLDLSKEARQTIEEGERGRDV